MARDVVFITEMACSFCLGEDYEGDMLVSGDKSFHWTCALIRLDERTMSKASDPEKNRSDQGMDPEKTAILERLVECYDNPNAQNVLKKALISVGEKYKCLAHAVSISAPQSVLAEILKWIPPLDEPSNFTQVVIEAQRTNNEGFLRMIAPAAFNKISCKQWTKVIEFLAVEDNLQVIQWIKTLKLFHIGSVDLLPAIRLNNIAVCEYLLRNRFCWESFSVSWLHEALTHCCYEIYQLLLEHGTLDYFEMLKLSWIRPEDLCIDDEFKCFKTLIKHFDSPKLRDVLKGIYSQLNSNPPLAALQYLLQFTDEERFKEDIDDVLNNVVLMVRPGGNSVETSSWLLKNGANPYAENAQAFLQVCETAELTEILKLFLEIEPLRCKAVKSFNYPHITHSWIIGSLTAVERCCFENFKMIALQKNFDIRCHDDILFRTALKNYVSRGKHENVEIALKFTSELSKIINLLIDLGADIHVDDDYALFAAATNDNLALLSRLLKMGADPDACGSRAFKAAPIFKDETSLCVGFMVDAGADICVDDNFVLKKAVEVGSPVIFSFLVDVGASLDSGIFGLILKHGHLNIMRRYLEYHPELPPSREFKTEILEAFKSGHYDLIKYLHGMGWLNEFNDLHVFSSIQSDDVRLLDLVWPADGPSMINQVRQGFCSVLGDIQRMFRDIKTIAMAKAVGTRVKDQTLWYQALSEYCLASGNSSIFTLAVQEIRRLGGQLPQLSPIIQKKRLVMLKAYFEIGHAITTPSEFEKYILEAAPLCHLIMDYLNSKLAEVTGGQDFIALNPRRVWSLMAVSLEAQSDPEYVRRMHEIRSMIKLY